MQQDGEGRRNRFSRNHSIASAQISFKYDENNNISFTYFSDPAKLKTYLACGLPVLLTNVSYNAEEIENKGCGRIITNNAKDVAISVVKIMGNETKLKEYRNNSLKYSRKYNWNNIFRKILKQNVEN